MVVNLHENQFPVDQKKIKEELVFLLENFKELRNLSKLFR